MIDSAPPRYTTHVSRRTCTIYTICTLALAGCSNDFIAAEAGETETGETGAPTLECDEPPREFDGPVGMWFEPTPGVFELHRPVITPGGDLVWVMANVLGRWDRTGQPRWEQPASDDTAYAAIGITMDEQLVVVGVTDMDDRKLAIERFDRDGVLLDRASFEHTPGENEFVRQAAVSPRGDVLVELRLADVPDGEPSDALVFVDRELQERWVVPPAPRFNVVLGFDADDNAYMLSTGHAEPPPDEPDLPPAAVAWPTTLIAFDEQGNERWSVTDDLLAQTNPRLQLAIGDHVYIHFFDEPQFAMSPTSSLIRAYDFDGSPVGELTLDVEVEPHAIAASPCGGLYLVGLAPEPDGGRSMAIWSLDSENERGPFTRVPLGDDVRIDGMLVSPLDEVVVHGSDYAGSTDWMLSF